MILYIMLFLILDVLYDIFIKKEDKSALWRLLTPVTVILLYYTKLSNFVHDNIKLILSLLAAIATVAIAVFGNSYKIED